MPSVNTLSALPDGTELTADHTAVSLHPAPLKTALTAPQVEYAYDGGMCYAVLPDGTHTRGYLNQEAAHKAALRGAVFTREEYQRRMRWVPSWYAEITT